MKLAAFLSYFALFFFGSLQITGANAGSFGTKAAASHASSVVSKDRKDFAFITSQDNESYNFHHFFADQEDDNDDDSDDSSSPKFVKDAFASITPDYSIHAFQYKKLSIAPHRNSETTPLFISLRVLRI